MPGSRVVIVDRHPITQRGLTSLLCEQGYHVSWAGSDPALAHAEIGKATPDLVIMDLTAELWMLLEKIRKDYPQTKILVFSHQPDDMFAERALRGGALGYVNKSASTGDILRAVEQVLKGEVYVSPDMATRLLHSVVVGTPVSANPVSQLSTREMQVFEMIGQGLKTSEIAAKLQLSPKTIETHREKIKAKLDLANSNELNRRAVQWVLEQH